MITTRIGVSSGWFYKMKTDIIDLKTFLSPLTFSKKTTLRKMLIISRQMIVRENAFVGTNRGA